MKLLAISTFYPSLSPSKCLSISIMLSILFFFSSCKKELDKDMQVNNFGDIRADFTWIDIDNPSTDSNNLGISLETNTILIESTNIKTVFTPLQKIKLIRMKDIVIFDNFEILFDMNIISKNIFGAIDRQRFTQVQSLLNKLQMRYANRQSENCRFIFTNNIDNMNGLNYNNAFTQVNDLNSFMSLIINVFCFPTIDLAVTFYSNFLMMYNIFIYSI
jgi:hypothetical protein